MAQWQEAQRAWSEWWQRSGTAADRRGARAGSPTFPADVAAAERALPARSWRRCGAPCSKLPRRRPLPEIVEQPRRRSPLRAPRLARAAVLLAAAPVVSPLRRRTCASSRRLAPLPEHEKRRLAFATRQYLDAIAPTNFPRPIRMCCARAIETEGASLVQGLRNLAERRAQGPHHDDRRARVRSRPQPRGHAGQRRVSQRADRAHPVRRDDAQGRQAAARHGAAVHQQVLHPRPDARQFVRRARGRAGAYGVHRVVAQHPAGARHAHVGRLPRARAC